MTVVHVPQNEAAAVIRELLAAAQELGLPPSVVRTSSDGLFGFSLIVPDEVHLLANGVTQDDLDAVQEPEKPKKKGGRPRKAAAEPVVEEQE
jgi:hypothetical protein